MPKPPPFHPRDQHRPVTHAVRVTNVKPIITREGDLIIAGTKGTLLAWVPGSMNETAIEAADDRALVMVAWDDYMYVDSRQAKDPPDACTLSRKDLFLCHTEVRNIRRLP